MCTDLFRGDSHTPELLRINPNGLVPVMLKWMFWAGEQWRIFSTTLFNEHVLKKVWRLPPDDHIVDWDVTGLRAAATVLDAHLDRRVDGKLAELGVTL